MKELFVKLENLEFHAHHGVLPQETKVGNTFVVSVSIKLPFDDKLYDDDLDATVNYATLYEIVRRHMNTPKRLLECVAANIADEIILTWKKISGGEITISKSTPPINGITGSAKVTLIF